MGVVRLSNAGIRDFQKTDSALAGNTAFAPDDEDFLEEVVLTSAASSVSFTGLGAYSDYKHLQIRYVARGTAPQTGVYTNLNGSSLADNHYLLGDGSSVSSNSAGTANQIGLMAGSGAATDEFRGGVIDLLDAFSTTKNKTLRSLTSSQSVIILFAGLWANPSSITSWELDNINGDFLAGSRFSLYGSK